MPYFISQRKCTYAEKVQGSCGARERIHQQLVKQPESPTTSAVFPLSSVVKDIKERLHLQNKKIVPAPGDGLCLIHAVIIACHVSLQKKITLQDCCNKIALYVVKNSDTLVTWYAASTGNKANKEEFVEAVIYYLQNLNW